MIAKCEENGKYEKDRTPCANLRSDFERKMINRMITRLFVLEERKREKTNIRSQPIMCLIIRTLFISLISASRASCRFCFFSSSSSSMDLPTPMSNFLLSHYEKYDAVNFVFSLMSDTFHSHMRNNSYSPANCLENQSSGYAKICDHSKHFCVSCGLSVVSPYV